MGARKKLARATRVAPESTVVRPRHAPGPQFIEDNAARYTPTPDMEITYRLLRSVGRGRVIEATPTTALVVPRCQDTEPSHGHGGCVSLVKPPPSPPKVHRLSRPHPGAPWKLHVAEAIGHHRPDPDGMVATKSAKAWAAIRAAGLVPAAYDLPLEGEPHTLTRLRCVADRLRMMGGMLHTVEECVAMLIFPPPYGTGEDRRPRFLAVAYKLEEARRETMFCDEQYVAYLSVVAQRYASDIHAALINELRASVVMVMTDWRNDRSRRLTRDERHRLDLRAPLSVVMRRLDGWKKRDLVTDEMIAAAYHAECARIDHEMVRIYAGLHTMFREEGT